MTGSVSAALSDNTTPDSERWAPFVQDASNVALWCRGTAYFYLYCADEVELLVVRPLRSALVADMTTMAVP